jgi:hypothetical protein
MNYDKDVGLQFLKDMGLLPSSMVCSVCGCHMSCVGASVKDGSVGEMGGKHLLPDTTFLGLSGTVNGYTHHTVNNRSPSSMSVLRVIRRRSRVRGAMLKLSSTRTIAKGITCTISPTTCSQRHVTVGRHRFVFTSSVTGDASRIT